MARARWFVPASSGCLARRIAHGDLCLVSNCLIELRPGLARLDIAGAEVLRHALRDAQTVDSHALIVCARELECQMTVTDVDLRTVGEFEHKPATLALEHVHLPRRPHR